MIDAKEECEMNNSFSLLNSEGRNIGKVTINNLEEYMNRFSWI